MKLEAIALEGLGQEGAFGCLLLLSGTERIAKDGQTTVLLPVLAEAPLDAVDNAWVCRSKDANLVAVLLVAGRMRLCVELPERQCKR